MFSTTVNALTKGPCEQVNDLDGKGRRYCFDPTIGEGGEIVHIVS